MGFKIELENLSQDFSFSRALSPAGRSDAYNLINLSSIKFRGQHIDPIFTILLALNEECVELGRGCFYHTPLRAQKEYGHPCDLVFIDEIWTELDNSVWKSINWAQRLELCKAGTNIGLSEIVIPISARIFLCDKVKDHANHEQSLDDTNSSYDVETRVVNEIGSNHNFSEPTISTSSSDRTFHSALPLGSSGSPQRYEPALTKLYDPVIKPGSRTYSRPIDDISTILIHWDDVCTAPHMCLSAAAEHESMCARHPTPNDLSETFEPCENPPRKRRYDTDKKDTPLYASVAARAAKHVLRGKVGNNKELILKLLDFSDTDNYEARKDLAMFGRINYLWGELSARINVNTAWREVDLLDFWPKE